MLWTPWKRSASQRENSHQPSRPNTEASSGRLNWLCGQTRADLAFGTSKAAAYNAGATIAQVCELNATVKQAREHADFYIRFPRGQPPVRDNSNVIFADCAFANMPGSKSQCGHIGFLASNPEKMVDLDFRKSIPMW